MANNRTITRKVAEGCKPSARPDRRIWPSGHGPADAEPSHAFAGESTIADARSLTHSPTITRSPSPKARAKAENAEARTQKRGSEGEIRPTEAGGGGAGAGYGGRRQRAAGRVWNTRGPSRRHRAVLVWGIGWSMRLAAGHGG